MSRDEFIYLPPPLDVVAALMQRAWDCDVTDDDRQLLEIAAKSLEASLNRNVVLASALEKTEAMQ
jgi:hypothetical protein